MTIERETTVDYASLLLLVEDSPYREAVTDAALYVTDYFNAHLTGLHIHLPDYGAHMAAGGYMVTPEVASLEFSGAEAADRASRLEAAFMEQARRAGRVDVDWRYHAEAFADGGMADVLALHARYADLLVVGQHDPRDYGSRIGADTPAVVAAISGRPALILPYNMDFDSLGQRIVLAWNATREATRAITAALPLLKRAASVEIVIVDEDEARTRRVYGDEPGADIARFVARHGVNVSVSRLHGDDLRVSEMLSSAVVDSGADLLVMGAYGHSRMREMIFGGTTHELMRGMIVPTLIAS